MLGLKQYLNRFKKHLRGGDSGLGHGKLNRIIVDVVVKGLLDLFSRLIAPAMSRFFEDYEWRRKDLNKQRKILKQRVKNSAANANPIIFTFLDFIHLVADNDPPYYAHYKNMVNAIQTDFRQLDKFDVIWPDLKEGVEPTESEIYSYTARELCQEHGVDPRKITPGGLV